MEYLDVVNKNDEVIGKASRDEIYAKSLCHRIVHVLIFNDKGEMALQLRSSKVYFCPRHWSTAVGGHVQLGETYEQAALREYEEELGVNSDLEFFSKDYYIAHGSPEKFVVVYKTQFDGRFNPDPDDVERVDYFSLEKIAKMIEDNEKFHPELLFILKKYFL